MPNQRRIPKWVWIVVIVAAVLLCACGGVMAIGAAAPTPHSTAGTQATNDPIQSISTPKAAPKTITASGRNSSVKQLGAALTGKYRVDYTGSSLCIIVDFLQANGDDGAGFMEGINDCTPDLNAKISGSTIVTLTSVTMVHVDNTHGAWTLRFTPI